MAEAFRPWLVGQVEACAQRSLNDNTKKSREYHWHVRVLLQGILAEYDRRAESAERHVQTLTAERDGLKTRLSALQRYQLMVHIGRLEPLAMPFSSDPHDKGAFIRADDLDAAIAPLEHRQTGEECLTAHYSGDWRNPQVLPPCVKCSCGAWVRPDELATHLTPPVRSAKEDA